MYVVNRQSINSPEVIRLLPSSGAIVNCDHANSLVGWLVGSFVRSFVTLARCDLSKSVRPILVKYGTDFQHLRRTLPLTLRGQG